MLLKDFNDELRGEEGSIADFGSLYSSAAEKLEKITGSGVHVVKKGYFHEV